MYRRERNNNDRRGRDNRRGHDRREGEKENKKITDLLTNVKNELAGSIEPFSIKDLNSFERKLVHRHFDHNPNIVTKTYRNGEDYEIRVYPVGNLIRFAEEKAQEVISTRKKVALPHMSSYARYVVHDALKTNDSIKVQSYGEGDERHIEIEPELFGRGLKRIIKKIKLI